MVISKAKRSCIILLSMLTAISLFGCAGLADYNTKLGGGYELWRVNSWEIVICRVDPQRPALGDSVIEAFVSEVAFNHQYIFARQLVLDRENSPPVDLDGEPVYYIITLASGEISGPMTAEEFLQWRTTAGEAEPEWVSSRNQKQLSQRFDELYNNG